MTAELGHFALVLAFVIACIQAVIPLIGAARRNPGAMALAVPAAVVQCALVTLSFAMLVKAFVTSDFSLRLVTLNSHSAKPLLYKFTGVWGNHEGSMLLWVFIVTLFGMAVAVFGQGLPPSFKARVLAVQGMIGAAFMGFLIFTSNPFLRLVVPPMDGQDLNPLLQDPGLAFHPPFLYLGYVGLSMTYSFAVAALIQGRVDAAWGRWVRPYTLAAWMFLTIGIGLGSWWAYYELGWGGFWFWDPVENASFMPWLISAALLHSAIVVEKRESLKSWTILLAIIAFGFSMVGAFITRSGIITSVHAFTNDPARGQFLLEILAVFMIGALGLFAWRGPVMQARGVFAPVSREAVLIVNNVLLGVAAFVVFVGTIWPLVAELSFGRKLSVGAPFFNQAFTPFMIALGLILPIGAMLPWKRAHLSRVLRRLMPAFALSLAVAGLFWAIQSGRSVMGPVGLFLGTWLIAGAVTDVLSRAGFEPRRLMRLPRADWGRGIAHAGFGVVIAGIAGLLAWQAEDIRVAQIGDSWDIAGYTLTLTEVNDGRGPNYFTTRADIRLDQAGAEIGLLHPEKRLYPVAGMPTTEAAIDNGFLRDIYVALGDPQADGGWAVRTYYKPLANWIWGGAILMALGGLASLSDRRYRVAAGARAEDQTAKRGGGDMSRFILRLCALTMCLWTTPSFAVQPDEVLSDPALEARARDISQGLRCLVCRNENIDDSDADLARDLRVLVRERLTAGDSDDDVVAYVVDRYGEYVLLEPTTTGSNLLLWAAGPLMLLFGGVMVVMYMRRHNAAREPELETLSSEEQDRLNDILARKSE